MKKPYSYRKTHNANQHSAGIKCLNLSNTLSIFTAAFNSS